MKLSAIKNILPDLAAVNFILSDGTPVPAHFHVTEVGLVNKHFIDCGGVVRTEKKVNFQLWNANDLDHRLKPQKLLNIIQLSEKVLSIEDAEIEVEYQANTIGKYGLDFNGKDFVLTTTQTACLATDACGVKPEVQQINFIKLDTTTENSCVPGGGCC